MRKTRAWTKLVSVALLFVGLMLSATYVFAQNVGTITRLDGTAQIQRGTVTNAATLNEAVQLHDKITTGPNTWLTISMLGGSSLTLSSSSTLTIDESMMVGGTVAPSKVSLLNGRLHTLIAGAMRSTTATAFEVHTPNAVGAVRGTEWDESYEEGAPKSTRYPDCLKFTEVWTEEGCVGVSNPAVPNSEQQVCAGKYVIVPCGYIPMGAEAAGAAAAAGTLDPLYLAPLGALGAGLGVGAAVLGGTSGTSNATPSK